MATYDSYVICTAPRSGSTLLCRLLAATGVAGNPDSHFHRQSLEHWLADLGVTPAPGLSERERAELAVKAAIAEGTRGGMFGLRLQRQSFAFLMQTLAKLHPDCANDVERFEAAFGRTLFLHLTRQDKVEEAVSLVKAQQTGLWHRAPDGTEIERLAPPKEPVYDAVALREALDEVTAYEAGRGRWFARGGVAPLRLAYAELAGDPLESLRRVLDRLGPGRAAADGVEIGVAKLADDTNRDWIARFRAELATPA